MEIRPSGGGVGSHQYTLLADSLKWEQYSKLLKGSLLKDLTLSC